MSETRSLISASDINRHKTLYWLVLTFLIIAFSLIFLFPFYWLVTAALKDTREIVDPVPTLFPRSFHPETFKLAWEQMNIAHYFLNTLYYVVGGWLFQLIVDVSAAYALSKLRPALGKWVLGGMLASLMLPMSALLVPTYLTVTEVPLISQIIGEPVNLLNTPWALWLPAAANAFNIYVLKRFFDQIPAELLDAAHIDGAGTLRVLWSVVLPLSRPVLAVISIFAVVGMWKDFLWPLLVLQIPDKQTLSVALSRLSSNGLVPLNELMAGLVIASIPMIAIFLVFQRSILRGLSAGSLKG